MMNSRSVFSLRNSMPRQNLHLRRCRAGTSAWFALCRDGGDVQVGHMLGGVALWDLSTDDAQARVIRKMPPSEGGCRICWLQTPGLAPQPSGAPAQFLNEPWAELQCWQGSMAGSLISLLTNAHTQMVAELRG